MFEGLIGFLVVALIVAIILGVLLWLISFLPIEARFKQFAQVVLILIAILVLLARGIPLLTSAG